MYMRMRFCCPLPTVINPCLETIVQPVYGGHTHKFLYTWKKHAPGVQECASRVEEIVESVFIGTNGKRAS